MQITVRGLVIQSPSAETPNGDMIRIADPNNLHPDGYVKYYNRLGQPTNPLTGKPGSDNETHIDLNFNYKGELKEWPHD